MVKNFFKQKTIYRLILIIGLLTYTFNFSVFKVSAESIFNLIGLVYYSNGNNPVPGNGSTPNSFASAKAYRTNIASNIATSNTPSEGRIYPAINGDPAYFLFDVGSSSWNPFPQVQDTSIIVLESYPGLNGWSGPAYVAGVKTPITQTHLNSNALDYSDSNVTNPAQNAVLELIPTPEFESNTYNSITLGWNALWDNNTGNSNGGSSHSSIVGYSVYRNSNGGNYEFRGSAVQNSGQRIVYTDNSVALGINYTYKIKVQFDWSADSKTYLESIGESSASQIMNVKTPEPDRLVFLSSPQTITVGNTSDVLTIQTRDADGNTIPVLSNTLINLSSNSTGVNKKFFLAQDNICTQIEISSIEILAGDSSTQFCYYDEKSSETVWTISAAKSLPLSPVWLNATQDIVVKSGTLNSFNFGLSSPQNNKISFSGVNTLVALDSFNNIIKDFNAEEDNVTITVSPNNGNVTGLGGSGNVLLSSSDFINGIANLNNKLTYSGISGNHAFIATSSSGITSLSNEIFINSATAVELSATVPLNVVAGQQFNITSISAIDEFGNIDNNFSGVKIVQYSGPSSSTLGSVPVYTTAVNFANGISTTVLATILVKAETTKLNIVIDGLTGESNNFIVDPASASSLNITVPQNVTVGENFSLNLEAIDPYGNIDTNYLGTKILSYSGPANGPISGVPQYTTEVSFINGISSNNSTMLVKKESVRIIVSDGTINGTSNLVNVASGVVGSLVYVSGNDQIARINSFLPLPLEVEVKDLYGNPKEDYPVNFVITKGNGSLAISNPLTDTNGKATQNFRLGTLASVNSDQVTVTVAGLNNTSIIFNATATPNDAVNLLVNAPNNVTAGQSFNLNLSVVDDEGNIVIDYSGEKTITYTGASNSLNNTSPIYSNQVQFINGIASNVSITLFKAENITLDLNIVSDGLDGVSNSIQVKAAQTSSFLVLAPQTVQSGIPFNIISITTVDDYANLTTDDYIGLKTLEYSGPSIDPISGQNPSYTTEVNFENGQATTELITTLYKAETVNILIKDGEVEGLSNSITVTYNEDYVIYYVSGNNQTGIIGQKLALPLKVKVLDSLGNAALDKEVRFLVTNGEGSVLMNNIIDAETGEIATEWTLGTSVGSQSIVASIDGSNTTVTFSATAVSDSASTINISPIILNTFVGYSTEELSVCLFDAFGNQVTASLNREIGLNSNSGTGQFSNSSTGPWDQVSFQILAGQSCVDIYYKDLTPGSFTITALSTSLISGVTTVNVLPLVPTTIIVNPSSFSLRNNTTQQITAVVYDQFNRSMSNVDLEWSVTSSTVGSINSEGLFTAGSTAGSYNNGIIVSYGGVIAYSTPTVVVDQVQQPPTPPSQPVVQPQLTPIEPTIPVQTNPTIPTTPVVITVDQSYYSDQKGEIPIEIEIPEISILSPRQGAVILSSGSVNISGISIPNQLILIKDADNNVLNSVTSDKNGYWKIFISRENFRSSRGEITASINNTEISTLPIKFDFRPNSIFEYILDFIFQ